MYSVALATFNGGKYIHEQLSSILNQTIRPCEIVVGDDQSQDDTIGIINQLAADNPDIKWNIIKHSVNLGFVKNFESIIEACSGRFVFLSDQDDVWINSKAEELLKILKQENFKVVFSDAKVTDSILRPSGKTMFEITGFEKHMRSNWKSGKSALNKVLSGNIVTGATLAFDREYVIRMFPKPEAANFIHDSWIAAISRLDNQLTFSEKVLILYRQHDKNAIGIAEDDDEFDKRISNADLINDLEIKYHRERDLMNYLITKTNLVPSESIKYLQKRQKLYNALLLKKAGFMGRLLTLSPALFFQKIPNFNTIRSFLGNGYIYISDRK